MADTPSPLTIRERELLLQAAGLRFADDEADFFDAASHLTVEAITRDEESRKALEGLQTAGLLGVAPFHSLTQAGRDLAPTLQVKCVERIDFPTARELLKFLAPEADHWGTDWDSPWIFRGHGDSRWTLRPSAWRPDGQRILNHLRPELLQQWKKDFERRGIFTDLNPHLTDGNPIFERALEEDALRAFAETANDLGLEVRGLASIQSGIEFLTDPAKHLPMPSELHALAQHHGVPTRLLDFTSSPFVAAYFAADDGARLSEERQQYVGEDSAQESIVPSHITVWALDTRALGQYSETRYGPIGDRDGPQLLQVARAGNTFLHAQSGLFVWDDSAGDYFRARRSWPRLDETLDCNHKESEDGVLPKQPLREMRLRIDEVDELMRLLWRMGITIAKLMPTYTHVTQALRRRWSSNKAKA